MGENCDSMGLGVYKNKNVPKWEYYCKII